MLAPYWFDLQTSCCAGVIQTLTSGGVRIFADEDSPKSLGRVTAFPQALRKRRNQFIQVLLSGWLQRHKVRLCAHLKGSKTKFDADWRSTAHDLHGIGRDRQADAQPAMRQRRHYGVTSQAHAIVMADRWPENFRPRLDRPYPILDDRRALLPDPQISQVPGQLSALQPDPLDQ